MKLITENMYAKCDTEESQYKLMALLTIRQMAMPLTVLIFTSRMEATSK
jgi:hypothetical protein